MTRPGPKIVLAAGGCLLLGLLAVWQSLAPMSLSLPAAHAPGVGRAVEGGAGSLELASREAYAEVEQRPLFVPGRRAPAVPEGDDAASGAQSLDRYAVIGIVAAPDRATAIVRAEGGQAIHLREGQALDGWTLQSIAPNKLVFTAGGQHQVLEFKNNAGTGSAGPGTIKRMSPSPAGTDPSGESIAQ